MIWNVSIRFKCVQADTAKCSVCTVLPWSQRVPVYGGWHKHCPSPSGPLLHTPCTQSHSAQRHDTSQIQTNIWGTLLQLLNIQQSSNLWSVLLFVLTGTATHTHIFTRDISSEPTFITLFSKRVWILTLLTGKARKAILERKHIFLTCYHCFTTSKRHQQSRRTNPRFQTYNVQCRISPQTSQKHKKHQQKTSKTTDRERDWETWAAVRSLSSC